MRLSLAATVNILPMSRNRFMCHKVGLVFPMVVVPTLPHTEFGRNDHREDAPHFRFMLTKVSWYHGFIDQILEGSCISWYPFHTVKSYTILFTLLCYVEITNVIMWLGPDRRKIYYDSVRRNNRSNSCDVSKDPFDKVLSSKTDLSSSGFACLCSILISNYFFMNTKKRPF